MWCGNGVMDWVKCGLSCVSPSCCWKAGMVACDLSDPRHMRGPIAFLGVVSRSRHLLRTQSQS